MHSSLNAGTSACLDATWRAGQHLVTMKLRESMFEVEGTYSAGDLAKPLRGRLRTAVTIVPASWLRRKHSREIQ
jgi:hypothetical protein